MLKKHIFNLNTKKQLEYKIDWQYINFQTGNVIIITLFLYSYILKTQVYKYCFSAQLNSKV